MTSADLMMNYHSLSISIRLRTEAVRPVPAASRPAVDIDTGMEPGEPGPVRERAQSEFEHFFVTWRPLIRSEDADTEATPLLSARVRAAIRHVGDKAGC
jgi:hypothetical protein